MVSDLLHGPGVSIRIVEVQEGPVVGPVGLDAGRLHAVGEVHRSGVLHASLDEVRVRRLDVVDDEVGALERTGGHSSTEPGAEHDGTRRSRRGHLDHPEVLVRREVGVQPESQRVHVESPGAFHIAHRGDDDFQLPVHEALLLVRRPRVSGTTRWVERARPPKLIGSSMSGRPTPRYQVIRRSAHFLNIAGPAIVSAMVLTGLDKPPSGGTMTRTLSARLVGAALGGLCLLGACGSDPSPRAGGGATGTGAEVVAAETDAGPAGSSGAAPGACGLVSPDALATILQTAKPDEESITVETTERDLGGG